MAQLFVRLAFAICAVVISVYAFAAQSGGETVVPLELIALIQHEYPKDKIIQASDIDLNNCEEPKSPPGLVEGDFNGDNRTDYAVLLKSEKKPTKYKDQTFEAVEAKFAIFLGKNGGKFQHIHLTSIMQSPDHIIVWLAPVPPGVVEESPVMGDKKLTLRHQGILRYHCGKYADVYYWDGKAKRFESIRVVE
ncbi:MAG: hypothetical protein ACREIJ_02345 [Nitrospiraceae bacterium]